MLPSKELNIYPKTKRNVKALLSYYLDKYDLDKTDSIKIIETKSSLSLNQLEFIVQKLSESYEQIFLKHLKPPIRLSNLLAYGIEALTSDEGEFEGSGSKKKITLLFKEFVKKVKKNQQM